MSNNLVFISNNFTDIQQTAKELKTLECKQNNLESSGFIYLLEKTFSSISYEKNDVMKLE